MEYFSINELKPHPQNTYFFDDITGDNWTEFLGSVKTSGIIEPIVITQDKIIVSGHQRVRAAKELNIKEVLCKIKIYENNDKWSKDDLIIKDLIETNLRQRGIGNTNPIKLARCIKELERIYNIRDGSAGKRSLDGNNFRPNQEQLAEQLGINDRQIRNYKKLLQLIPEIQELIEHGKISATVGYKILAKLSPEEQTQLLSEIGRDKWEKLAQKQVQKYIEQYKEKEQKLLEENRRIKQELEETRQQYIKEIEKREKLANQNLNQYKQQLQKITKEKEMLEHEKLNLEKKLNSEDYELEQLRKKKEKLELETYISIFEWQLMTEEYLKKASPILYLQGAKVVDTTTIKDDVLDTIEALEKFIMNMREMIECRNKIVNVRDYDTEIIINKEEDFNANPHHLPATI